MHGLRSANPEKQHALPFLSFLLVVVCFLAVSTTGCKFLRHRIDQFRLASQMKALASLEPIDAHTHIEKSGPHFVAMLDRLHMHVLDILYVDDTNESHASLDQQRRDALDFIASSHGRASLCTTFDPFRIDDADFADSAIRALNADFQRGAVAVKVWKNVGMELKDRSGRFVLPDDRRFLPIYEDITKQGKTLIIHAADPDAAWTEQYATAGSARYYREHPQWNMSKTSGAPQKSAILEARSRVLEMNPELRVIGAHFASHLPQLDEMAALLDRYPNLAVDTAGRLPRLTTLPRAAVREFFLKYQDRILYGTDMSFEADATDEGAAEKWLRQYELEWRYYSSTDIFDYYGQQVQGLSLPQAILKKLYHDNATRWISGVVAHQD